MNNFSERILSINFVFPSFTVRLISLSLSIKNKKGTDYSPFLVREREKVYFCTAKQKAMEIRRLINAPLTSNNYLITDSSHALVIDPGTAGSAELLKMIKSEGLQVDYIVLTHEHFDHCAGVNALREATHALLACSATCDTLIRRSRGNYSAYWMEGEPFVVEAADILVANGDTMEWRGHKVHILAAPGHSKGSIAIIIDEMAFFTGDDFIPNMRTYTNLNGGSKSDLRRTLARFHTYTRFAGMTVYPGHGEAIAITKAAFNEGLRGYSTQQMMQEEALLP
jgi:hydroxyacylglutathione hydrolase